MTTPDPKGFYTEADGSIIPMGKGTDAGIGHSSLLYNEYPLHCISWFVFSLNKLRLSIAYFQLNYPYS